MKGSVSKSNRSVSWSQELLGIKMDSPGKIKCYSQGWGAWSWDEVSFVDTV